MLCLGNSPDRQQFILNYSSLEHVSWVRRMELFAINLDSVSDGESSYIRCERQLHYLYWGSV